MVAFVAGLWGTVSVRADLDVVFVLDTTGSMSGELSEVRERLEELTGSFAAARAGERIRYGVVAFRDRGDDYVTRQSPLTEDLESTRTFLGRLEAHGGGDGPEAVVAAVAAALETMAWDPVDETERLVFLVGDAPPHLDYEDDPEPRQLVATARSRRIVVNTIGCRSLPPNGVAFFRRLAYATEGSYQHIGRVRGAEDPDLVAAIGGAARPVTTDRGDPVGVAWLEHEPTPARALLVRQARPTGLDQESGGAALSSCALEVLLPGGIALTAEPVAELGTRGLEVELLIGAGEGGRDLFALERCPPLSTPIHVTVSGV